MNWSDPITILTGLAALALVQAAIYAVQANIVGHAPHGTRKHPAARP